MKKKNLEIVFYTVAFLFMAYYAVAGYTFALRHPDMTQTQKLIHLVDVLAWRQVPKEDY